MTLASSLLFSMTALAEMNYVPNEIIVKFKPGFKASNLRSLGVEENRSITTSFENLTVMKIAKDNFTDNVLTAIEKLKKNPNVVYAEPNFIYKVDPIRASAFSYKKVMSSPFYDSLASTPDDPEFSKLWGLNNTGSNEPKGQAGIEGADVNALKAWDLTKGDKKIKIAVIDTGVDYTHPDLKSNIYVNQAELQGKAGVDDDGNGYIDDVRGYDFANKDANPMDGHGHGTHCSGTIGAVHNNKVGVSGVMSDVSIVPIKFLTDDGSGTLEDAILSIDYATSLNVDLMSNSWGGGGYSQALFDAIKRASDKGIVFTAAAGNESSNNDTTPSFPASYNLPNVISVAALTAQNNLAYFSCYGRNSVHIAAPGHNILSTVSNGKYEVMSGTSMATPHVSGVIGLLLSKEGRMSHDVLREKVMMTSVPVPALRGKTATAGRIDAYNLLTDSRPQRSGPKNGQWKTITLKDSFESDHPYKDNAAVSKSYTFPGAKYVRVIFSKFDLEAGYDYVRVSDGSGQSIEKVTGAGVDYTTEYIEGDTVKLDFVSDRSINKWGFKVERVEAQ